MKTLATALILTFAATAASAQVAAPAQITQPGGANMGPAGGGSVAGPNRTPGTANVPTGRQPGSANMGNIGVGGGTTGTSVGIPGGTSGTPIPSTPVESSVAVPNQQQQPSFTPGAGGVGAPAATGAPQP